MLKRVNPGTDLADMKLAIMQPYFFPYLGYYQLVQAVDRFIFYDDVQFIQRGWINRNYVISKEGRSLFTIPLKAHSLDASINEVEVEQQSKWKSKLLKTFYYTYKKAPFFEDGYEIVNQTLSLNCRQIVPYCAASIHNVFSYLGIDRQFKYSSSIAHCSTGRISRLSEILAVEKAGMFVLPPGSRSLYSKEEFGIPTYFLNPSDTIAYPQFSSRPFEGRLSMVDALMFCSKAQIAELLQLYSLE